MTDDSPQPEAEPQARIALPAETLYHILRFLGPLDLIRLGTVSKLFHEIILDPSVWRTVYASARLPLPPGPFHWQSIHFLQRALVYSARLARTWTTEPLTLISKNVFTGPRTMDDDRFRWVRGRWLIVSKDMKQLRSRDVETGLEQVLWDHGSFAFWWATSVMNPVGHFLYAVVHLGKGHVTDPVYVVMFRWIGDIDLLCSKLVEFVVDDETGHLSGPEIIDVPTWALPQEAFIPRIRVYSSIVPYAYISLCSTKKPRQSLIFDPQHRRFYKFPSFRTQLDLLLNYRGAWLPHLVEVYFTTPYLFVLNRSYLIHGNIGQTEVIQVFGFPDIDVDSAPNHTSESAPVGLADSATISSIVYELRLTHETSSRDTRSMWLTPLRDAFQDPITHTTTLRFMHGYAPLQHNPTSHVRLACTDYILPPPHPGPTWSITADDALKNRPRHVNIHTLMQDNLNAIVRSPEEVRPITVASHDVLSLRGVWNGNLLDVSADGFVRGLCMVGFYSEGASTPDVGMVYKFIVDATGERCVAVVGDPSPPWVDLETARYYEYSLDGMRGRLWHTKGDVRQNDSSGRPVDQDVLAIVADFK